VLLSDLAGCYKIKSKSSGCSLVYEVTESELILLLITVGKRERGESYSDAKAELDNIKEGIQLHLFKSLLIARFSTWMTKKKKI
jgi:hypothetical protein